MALEESVVQILDSRLSLIRIVNNQVILNVNEEMTSGLRGKLLLDTEKMLRKELGRPLEVLLEPRGDLNKLRQQLRGVSLEGSRDDTFQQRYRQSELQSDGGIADNG